MERLVLRGIMYGADKIPESWFDKVPGGYYKEKEQKRKQHEKDEKRDRKRSKSRRRRHSDEHEDRRSRYDDEDYDERERRSRPDDRRRPHGRSRSSYDGGGDHDSEYDQREERRARRRGGRDDDDRYGYNDGSSRPSRHSYAADGRPNDFSPMGSQRSSHHSGTTDFTRQRNAAAAAAASAGTAAAVTQQTQRHSPSNVPSAVPVAPGANKYDPARYIPYSHIYGVNASQSPAAAQMFSPPPVSSVSSVQANSMNQMSPPYSPPNSYDYAPAGAAYGQRGYQDPHEAPYNQSQDPYLGSRSSSPSFNSAATPPRRARSERRPHRDSNTNSVSNKSRGKSLTRFRENLGLSQQGLGYSAVGAAAGGLVGSGLGKGKMPAALGAAIGGIGANALGASQRRRDDRRTSEWALDQDLGARREERERSRREVANGNRSE